MAQIDSGSIGGVISSIAISVNAIGDTTLIVATPGKSIIVISYLLCASVGTSFKWKDSTPADLSGSIPLPSNIPFVFNGHLQGPGPICAQGKDLVISTVLAAGLGGHLCYVLA